MTPSGISTNVSTNAGLETPEMIELRKKTIESEVEDSETPALYKIVPEKAISVGSSMMGSSKIYDLTAVKKLGLDSKSNEIDIALNPEELELDTEILQARYNQQLKQQGGADGADVMHDEGSDHTIRQQKKRKKQQDIQISSKEDKDKASKKMKEFKF